MNLHLPTMLFAAVVLSTLVASVMSIVCVTHRTYRGYALWVAAQWLAVAGLLALALDQVSPSHTLASQLLLLPWPIATLLGLRRFHARQPLPGDSRRDAAILAIAAGASAAVHGLPSAGAQAAGTGTVAALVGAYVVAVLLTTRTLHESAAMRLLTGSLVLATLAQVAGAITAAVTGQDTRQVMALPTALLAASMGFVALLLTHERTVRELRESRRRLRFLANIDMLTQVPNRRHFGELARRLLQRDPERAAAVLMFDIDHFKRINDELGHAAGDRALRVVSRCVQDTLRANDVAGRHGGDEFVLLLPGTSLRDAMAVATRIVARAQELATSQAIPELSLSFGVVQMRSDESLDEAMRRADQALYEAKRQGRGRAVSAAGNEHRPVFVESRRLGLSVY